MIIANNAKTEGFVSREPARKNQRTRSPYIIQKNIKMRINMPELLEKLTALTNGKSDQETIEYALLALIEKFCCKKDPFCNILTFHLYPAETRLQKPVAILLLQK